MARLRLGFGQRESILSLRRPRQRSSRTACRGRGRGRASAWSSRLSRCRACRPRSEGATNERDADRLPAGGAGASTGKRTTTVIFSSRRNSVFGAPSTRRGEGVNRDRLAQPGPRSDRSAPRRCDSASARCRRSPGTVPARSPANDCTTSGWSSPACAAVGRSIRVDREDHRVRLAAVALCGPVELVAGGSRWLRLRLHPAKSGTADAAGRPR